MTGAAAQYHRGDVEGAEAGCGLPGMEDSAAGAGDGVDVGARRGGDAAGPLEQVEHGALGAKEAFERAVQHADDSAGIDCAPLLRAPVDAAGARPRHRVGVSDAGQYAPAPIFDDAFGLESRRHGDRGGDVGVAVLGEDRGGYPRRVRAHFPSATMRSIAPRARAAISAGTVM